MASIKRPPVFRVPLIQLGVLLPLALSAVWVDLILAKSVLVGGLLSVIPHFYFTFYAYRYSGARAARQVVQSFYRGETGKFVMTFLGFGFVFLLFKSVNVLALFVGYVLMLVVQWWATAKVMSAKGVV